MVSERSLPGYSDVDDKNSGMVEVSSSDEDDSVNNFKAPDEVVHYKSNKMWQNAVDEVKKRSRPKPRFTLGKIVKLAAMEKKLNFKTDSF